MGNAVEEFKALVPWRRVITLERTPQRLVDFQQRLLSSGLPGELFTPLWGYDASAVKTSLLMGRSPRGWHNRLGDFGCYVSHLLAYQDMMMSEGEWALLVEDDCLFADDFAEKAVELINHAPSDAHGIYLGGEHKRRPLMFSDLFYKVMGAQRTHCILYRLPRVSEVYMLATRGSESIDQILRRNHPLLRFYCPHAHVAAQAPMLSTIGRSWKQAMWWHPRPWEGYDPLGDTAQGSKSESGNERASRSEGEDMGRRPMTSDDATTALREFLAVADQLGVKLWLTDGTLLGAVRENDFIKHDGDIDLGCFVEDYTWRRGGMTYELARRGFKLVQKYGSADCGLELTYRGHGVHVDVFFFYKCSQSGKWWHGAWERAQDYPGLFRLIQYRYSPFELTPAVFKGISCLMPADAEAYLIQKYGEGWRTPVEKWDWRTDPANARRTNIYAPRNDHEIIDNPER